MNLRSDWFIGFDREGLKIPRMTRQLSGPIVLGNARLYFFRCSTLMPPSPESQIPNADSPGYPSQKPIIILGQ